MLLGPPSDFVPEKDKNAKWFTDYARWIVATFYNQTKPPFAFSDVVIKGISQEAIDNWSYVFQSQQNNAYKFITEDYSGQALPSVWVAGGKIASLYDHLSGILLGAIENIEVTAQNLSKEVSSYKADLLEKLMIKYEVESVVKDMLPEGVSFDPINDPSADLAGPPEIEKYVTNWQDKYSIIAEKIGQSQMVMDSLHQKFLRSGQHQFVGGLSGILTEVEAGNVVNTVIPGYEVIWDNRQDDPLGEGAMICGYVKHSIPYLEVIRRYKDQIGDQGIEELQALARSGNDNMDEFLSYYNTGLGTGGRFNWWNNTGTSRMTLAVATVYFIAPRDFRYRDSTNRYGAPRTTRIDEEKEYSLSGKSTKGVDMPGDYEGYDLHQATLIGNRYIVNYGYANNVLRKHNKKGKPLLPMHTFCSNMVLNQGKSIVSRLRPLQDKLDMYAFKIQEKVANDWGKNYVFNGNKFPGSNAVQVANELKNLHVTISVPSGESDDPYAAQRLVEQIDMTLDSNIISYLELRRELEAEMNGITSVSQIALGQQGAVIGKAVQEQTIERNSYGTASLMWGLMKHFNQVMQYNVNLKQMLYQFSDTVEESLIIGDEGSYLLKILNPREFGTQPLMVFMDLASTLDPAMRAEIRTIALSEAQNGKLDLVDYIEHVLMAPTSRQAVKGLKDARNKRDREAKDEVANEQMAAQEQQLAAIQAQTLGQASLAQIKEDNANFREEFKAWAKQIEAAVTNLGVPPMPMPIAPPPSPLQQQMEAANQPPPMHEQQLT